MLKSFFTNNTKLLSRVSEDGRNVTSKGKSDYSRAEKLNDFKGRNLGIFFNCGC